MPKLRLRIKHLPKLVLVSQVIVLITALLIPALLLLTTPASAAQLTARKLTITSAVASATGVTYTYAFTTQSSTTIQSIEFEACTAAVGTCSAPAGININQGAEASRTGWSAVTPTTFLRSAGGGGGCAPASGVLCINRTDADSETAGARTLGWDTQTNQSSNATFFIRITLYTDNNWTTTLDAGTVAAATVQTLTVNANVAEVLNFCIGSTDANNATTDDPTGAAANDCTGVSGTSVHIGTLDTSAVNVSRVSTNGGNNKNGLALVRTNAASGIAISYRAIQASSGTNHLGTLRVGGASCEPAGGQTASNDPCINAAGTTQSTITNSTEEFGMTIAAINCLFVPATAYTCNFANGQYNLTRDTNYDGTGANTYPTDNEAVSGTTNAGYAWDESGATDQIASSVTVVADEALILKFGATPNLSTPFGVYSVQADFIAVPTY